jgi:hypothetical protein
MLIERCFAHSATSTNYHQANQTHRMEDVFTSSQVKSFFKAKVIQAYYTIRPIYYKARWFRLQLQGRGALEVMTGHGILIISSTTLLINNGHRFYYFLHGCVCLWIKIIHMYLGGQPKIPLCIVHGIIVNKFLELHSH